jgi:hypothetical protein
MVCETGTHRCKISKVILEEKLQIFQDGLCLMLRNVLTCEDCLKLEVGTLGLFVETGCVENWTLKFAAEAAHRTAAMLRDMLRGILYCYG